ncbi:dUTP diphosphatase [candidate division WOR-3 bacterium]|nr:dUTP diphosphatase [candidate division WOR-3 bacterium]
MKKIKIRVLRLKKDIPLPSRATPDSVGFDLHAAEATIIKSRSFGVVRTGIAIELPHGIEGQVRARSGLALRHGIGVLNSPGTIDPDYRGEVKVILFNFSDVDFEIKPKDRIAQIVFSRTVEVEFEEKHSLTPTKRGQGGFGHTGR